MMIVGSASMQTVACAPVLLPAKHYPRNKLVSCMLRDRSVVRMVCAPRGFGKTTLALEYARSVFKDNDVMWVSGKKPSFICDLDTDTFQMCSGKLRGSAKLVIIDDLPALDEIRASVFSTAIDQLLHEGYEVVVLSTPANDSLQNLQPDRIYISSRDLMVTEHEYIESLDSAHAAVPSLEMLSQLLGVPCLVWGQTASSAIDCVRGFFDEDLPDEFTSAALSMVLLGRGTFNDLAQVDGPYDLEVLETFASQYPLFGVDLLRGTFATIPIRVRDMATLSTAKGRAQAKHPSFHEKIVNRLLAYRDLERAARVVQTFYTEKNRRVWLIHTGWELIDSALAPVLCELLESLGNEDISEHDQLAGQYAWAHFMAGNPYKAVLFASSTVCDQKTHPLSSIPLVLLRLYQQTLRDPHMVNSADVSMRATILGHLTLIARGCTMRCLAMYSGAPMEREPGSEESPKCACSGLGRDERVCCTSWNILARAVLMRENLPIPPVAGLTQCEDDAALLSGLMEKADFLQDSGGYRIALHIIIAHLLGEESEGRSSGDAGDACRRMFLSPLSRFAVHSLSNGVSRLSEALLLFDCKRLGFFEKNTYGDSGESDRALLESQALLSFHSRIVGDLNEPSFDYSIGKKPAGNTGSLKCNERNAVPTLRICMLGGFKTYLDGKPFTPVDLNKRKVRMLLAFLTLHKGREVSREKIFDELWPSMDFRHARDSFYVAWCKMKGTLKDDQGRASYFERSDLTCKINREFVTSDIFDFEDLTRTILLERDNLPVLMETFMSMEKLYNGDLLTSDFSGSYFESLRVWYREMFVDAMVSASERARDEKDSLLDLYFARKAYEFGLSREDVYRNLMYAQLNAGQGTCAYDTFLKCKKFLADEIGVAPSEKTLQAYQEIFLAKPREKPAAKPRRLNS
ncbi:MAG: hypothetical protein HGA54_00790 [Actinobacteria bacterium]|nr:hypothetical protein [Actinomycetota bacterium]